MRSALPNSVSGRRVFTVAIRFSNNNARASPTGSATPAKVLKRCVNKPSTSARAAGSSGSSPRTLTATRVVRSVLSVAAPMAARMVSSAPRRVSSALSPAAWLLTLMSQRIVVARPAPRPKDAHLVTDVPRSNFGDFSDHSSHTSSASTAPSNSWCPAMPACSQVS